MKKLRSISRKIEKHDTVVIFGASDIGKLIYNEIKDFCAQTGKSLYFADNSYKKWDKNEGIVKPSDAAERFPGALWIIASDLRSEPMFKNLLSLNIDKDNIIKELPDEILQKKAELMKTKRLTPQDKISRIEVDIADHCNLKCAGCNHFSPLVKKPSNADFDIFDRDMERMAYLLSGNLQSVRLLGGEPLLNPQIDDFVHSARKHFPDTTIHIVTNGILLPEMQESFWKTCRDCNAMVSVTRYPINFKYNALPEIAGQHSVAFEFYQNAVDKTTINFAFDPSGKQDPYESFCNCIMANDCVTLRDGKLSTCKEILCIDFFNEAFGTSMEVCEEDYIDIYKAKSECEILEFLCKPVLFCRYCDVKNRTHDNPWRISKLDIGEWVYKPEGENDSI